MPRVRSDDETWLKALSEDGDFSSKLPLACNFTSFELLSIIWDLLFLCLLPLLQSVEVQASHSSINIER